jgi:hypothetical protein
MSDGKFSTPKEQAAGLPAVVSSLRQVFGKAGVVRGTKALLDLNQAGGFDCPSCAWPDPYRDRTHAEFCEARRRSLLKPWRKPSAGSSSPRTPWRS